MPKPDKDVFRLAHHSRNLGLLTEDNQDKISNTTLLIAGCGVGSQVALSAVRMGFEKFIIVDGDTVELSNNNRQGYSWRDVGRTKVDALAKKIKSINPHAHIRKYPIFIDAKNAERISKKADIIIDTIDPDAVIAVVALHRSAQKHKQTIIQPTDVGWGAMVQIFTPDSISYEEMIGMNPKTRIDRIDEKEGFAKFVEFFMKLMPTYVQELALDVAEGRRDHYPQPVSASYILSAMAIIAAKRIALGLPIRIAPEVIDFDPNLMFTPDEEK
ncbi:MAG: ThiF family adenylyltransferase [Patescibacteria group bacterium]